MRFVVRVSWLASALIPHALTTGDSTAVAPWLVWSAWGVVALASLVHHPLSLTTIRFIGPMLVAHGVSRSITGDTGWGLVAGVVLQAAAVIVAYSATYGGIHAQAAAYGHERRHLLRPPVAVILPVALLWSANTVIAGVVTYTDSAVVAACACAVFVVLLAFSMHRSLVLARRWLVFVPAGIAVHDPLLLRDTFMVRTHDIRRLGTTTPGSEAFDATGTTWGTPLELVLAHPHDVSLSNFGARMSRTLDRLHVTALLVSPSRSHDVLADQTVVPPPSTTRSSES